MGKQKSHISTSHSQAISLAQTSLRASSPTHGEQQGAQEVVQVRPQATGATAGARLSLVFSCSHTWRKTHCLKVERPLCSGNYWATQLKGGTVIILMMMTLESHLEDRWVMKNCHQMCASVSKGAKEGSPEVHLPSLCYTMGWNVENTFTLIPTKGFLWFTPELPSLHHCSPNSCILHQLWH